MSPLLYQAPSPPLVLKGISHLQHSLSISSKICCPQHKSEVTLRPWSSALTEEVLAASVAGNCTCWGGSSHLARHPKCLPVLTLLPRLQCDHGMSLQALARTLCCNQRDLGSLQSTSVGVGLSFRSNYDLIINSDSIHEFFYTKQ